MARIFALLLLFFISSNAHSQTLVWTWMNGEKHIPMRPVIGIKGVASLENNPGGRKDAVSWSDQNGNVWVFGGFGNGANDKGYFSDMWKYETSSNQWTWVAGTNNVNVFGSYGVQGVASDNNNPGGREGSCSWVGNDGNFYLFGGDGYGATAKGRLNDLWRFNPQTNQWTWLSGPNGVNTIGTYGIQGIASTNNWPGARNGGTVWKADNNTVWLFGGDGYASTNTLGRLNDMWRYDPSANQWTWMNGSGSINAATTTNAPGARNTGNTAWKDQVGNLYLFGGGTWGSYTGSVLNPPCVGCESNYGTYGDFWKYNTTTNVWTNITPPSSGTSGLPKPEARYHGLAWTDISGNFWLFGGYGQIKQSPQNSILESVQLNSLWKYDLTTKLWSKVNGDAYYTLMAGNYGTQGIASASNRRAARGSGVTWINADGKLYSFGGDFREEAPNTYRNDVWSYDPLTNLYTWIKGDTAATVTPVYSTQGLTATGNRPGERKGAGMWADKNGNLWLFGGDVLLRGDGPSYKTLNDLWKYNTNADQWTWMKGGLGFENPVYGVKGVPDPNNRPGTCENVLTWTDTSNNLWLYGGMGISGNVLSRLWKYDISSNQWTWVAGDNNSTTYYFNGIYGVQGVANSANDPGCRQISTTWTDNNGNLWLFGGRATNDRINDLWKYNPSSNQWTWMKGDKLPNQPSSFGILGVANSNNKPSARCGSAGWKDYAGNLWMLGGSEKVDVYGTNSYHNDLWKYDIATNQWIWINGDSAVNKAGVYGVKGIAAVSNKPGSRERPTSWTDNDGKFWLMGGYGYDVNGAAGYLNDVWMYDPNINQWVWVKGENTINTFSIAAIKGIGNAVNNPGGRFATASCKDNSGNLWLYGGWGFGESGQDRLTDLWRLSDGVSGNAANLLELNARLVNYDGILNWKAQNNGSSATFIIERSIDRLHFANLGAIVSNNTNGIQQFDFTDPFITSLGVPVLYYRIKQTDINGHTSYSNIVALTIDGSSLVMFYPNPVLHSANMTITVNYPETVHARIFNDAGALMKRFEWELVGGSTVVTMDMDVLMPGVYLLDISGKTVSKRIKFIKR